MPGKPFPKRALTVAEQIQQLTDRGLVIPDLKRLSHYLTFIGYFRLKEYGRCYEHPDAGKGLPNHQLLPGTSFEDVLNIYNFDRGLRILAMDALEKIELALRSVVSNTMCESFGAHWFMDAKHFATGYHQSLLQLAAEGTGRYAQGEKRQGLARFLVHYFDGEWDEQLPPSWMLCEVLSFPTWSKIYQNLADHLVQKTIARRFLIHSVYFESWLHALAHLRNICAHHNCCWNRKFIIKPLTPRIDGADVKQADSFYALAFIIHRFLRVIAPDSSWKSRLKKLLDDNPRIPVAKMGFPPGWSELKDWQ